MYGEKNNNEWLYQSINLWPKLFGNRLINDWASLRKLINIPENMVVAVIGMMAVAQAKMERTELVGMVVVGQVVGPAVVETLAKAELEWKKLVETVVIGAVERLLAVEHKTVAEKLLLTMILVRKYFAWETPVHSPTARD